jgi:amino acid transporter
VALAAYGPAMQSSGLRHQSLGALEVFAQSVATMGPTTVVALTPALVFTTAGNGTWLSMVIATGAVLVVAFCVSIFARRYATSASLYTYARRGLGPLGGASAGLGLTVGYAAVGAGCAIGAGAYFASWLELVGVHATSRWAEISLFLAFGALGAWFCYRGIQLSTRTALALEIVSIVSLLVILLATVLQVGVIFQEQLKLTGVAFSDLARGVVLAITAFVGFEAASTLGAEAREPHRSVPRALLLTVSGAGVLYLAAGYVEVGGFNARGQSITESAAPLNELAEIAGVAFLRYTIDIGVSISFLAAVIGLVNAGARMLYSFGRAGLAPQALARTHTRHRTPHVAILVLIPIVTLVPIVLVGIADVTPLEAFAYVATFGTFGFMWAYLLVAVAALAFLRRERRLGVSHVIGVALAATTLVGVFWTNVFPTPPAPYDVLPFAFLGVVTAATAVLGARQRRAPARWSEDHAAGVP